MSTKVYSHEQGESEPKIRSGFLRKFSLDFANRNSLLNLVQSSSSLRSISSSEELCKTPSSFVKRHASLRKLGPSTKNVLHIPEMRAQNVCSWFINPNSWTPDSGLRCFTCRIIGYTETSSSPRSTADISSATPVNESGCMHGHSGYFIVYRIEVMCAKHRWVTEQRYSHFLRLWDR